jgi:hypothetical protein
MFKNYMQRMPKKTINKFFSSAFHRVVHNSNGQMAFRNSREFTALIYLDSLYHSSLRKRAFKVKTFAFGREASVPIGADQANRRNAFDQQSRGCEQHIHRNIRSTPVGMHLLLNGKYVRKQFNLVRSSRGASSRFQKGGDFFIAGSINSSVVFCFWHCFLRVCSSFAEPQYLRLRSSFAAKQPFPSGRKGAAMPPVESQF